MHIHNTIEEQLRKCTKNTYHVQSAQEKVNVGDKNF